MTDKTPKPSPKKLPTDVPSETAVTGLPTVGDGGARARICDTGTPPAERVPTQNPTKP